jgi:hypothetical protein
LRRVGCAKSPCMARRRGTASTAILRTRSACPIDYSRKRASISAKSSPSERVACAKSPRKLCRIPAPRRAILHTVRSRAASCPLVTAPGYSGCQQFAKVGDMLDKRFGHHCAGASLRPGIDSTTPKTEHFPDRLDGFSHGPARDIPATYGDPGTRCKNSIVNLTQHAKQRVITVLDLHIHPKEHAL